MEQKFDYFNQAMKPNIKIMKPDNVNSSFITHIIKDPKIILRYNALSEFHFDIMESNDGGVTIFEAFSNVKGKKLIEVEDVGVFILMEDPEENDGTVPRKRVKCYSLEAEMLTKKVNILYGTCLFYNPLNPNSQEPRENLMGYLLSLLNNGVDPYGVAEFPEDPAEPYNYQQSWWVGWRLGGEIPAELATRYRTFDVSNTTVYNFLMNDIEEAYGCVFTFDTFNRIIYVYTIENATVSSNLFFSYENLLQNTEFNEKADEVVTALHVYGGDGLDIRSANPLGINIIYNFDYFKTTEWMQTNLIEAIDAWEQLIEDNIDTYNSLIVQYLELNDNGTIDEPGLSPGLYILKTQLINLQSQYEALEIALKAAIEAGTGVSAAKVALEAKENEIVAKQLEITSKELAIDTILQQISNINDLLDINNTDNFTKGQQLRLSKFMYENTYQNENIIVTDIFTPAQIQETKIGLYNQAQEVLSRISVPHYEFKMEAINFIHLPEFEKFTEQIPLSLGVEAIIDTGNIFVTAVLLELEYNIDSPSDFSMTFSNRLRLDGASFKYADLMGQVVKTGASVSFQKGNWSNWTREYKSNVSSFITSALDTTRNAILASQGQEITINGAGLRGKQLINPLDESQGYRPEQVWLTGNTLGFTDDNWNTLKTAIGRIDLGNGTYGYGLVGDYLIGNMIVGSNLTIETDSSLNSSFVVDSNGVSMTNMNLFAYSSSGESFVKIDPTDITSILRIGRKVGNALTTNFSVDNQGTVTMTGNLLINDYTYIKNNGEFSFGSSLSQRLYYDPSDQKVKYTGTISATKIEGSIQWSQITGAPLPTDRFNTSSGYSLNSITTGTLNATRIVGGTLDANLIKGTLAGLTGIYAGFGQFSDLTTDSLVSGYIAVGSEGVVASRSWVATNYYTQSQSDARYAYKFSGQSGTISWTSLDGGHSITMSNGIITSGY